MLSWLILCLVVRLTLQLPDSVCVSNLKSCFFWIKGSITIGSSLHIVCSFVQISRDTHSLNCYLSIGRGELNSLLVGAQTALNSKVDVAIKLSLERIRKHFYFCEFWNNFSSLSFTSLIKFSAVLQADFSFILQLSQKLCLVDLVSSHLNLYFSQIFITHFTSHFLGLFFNCIESTKKTVSRIFICFLQEVMVSIRLFLSILRKLFPFCCASESFHDPMMLSFPVVDLSSNGT